MGIELVEIELVEIESALGYLFEATKVMVPVVTGFLVVFGSSAARVWQSKEITDWTRIQKWAAGIAILFGILSLGLWTGSMAYCIRASTGANAVKFQFTGPFDPATNFLYGRYCASVGTYAFFSAVVSACVFFWKTSRGLRK